MALENMPIAEGTSLGTSGGTNITLSITGVDVPGGVQLIVVEDTNFQTRRTVTAKYRPASINPATGKYGKDKKSMVFVEPIVLEDGSVVFNTLRLEREVHPSTPEATVADYNVIGAQLLFRAEAAGFWRNGRTA